nr:histidine phosphatase family protein [Ideonella oryzae]
MVRHGQASFGAEDYDRLSDRGVAQARRLGQALKGAGVCGARVICGSLSRHRATAIHCLSGAGVIADPDVRPEWNEFDHLALLRAAWPAYGDMTQLRQDLAGSAAPRQRFQEIFETAMARWVDGVHDADYPETWPAFQQRCRQALDRLCEELPAQEDALVFTSGGPIAVIAQTLLGLQTPVALGLNAVLVNTGVTQLQVGRRGPRLTVFNAHEHLRQVGRDWITHR